MASLSYLRLRHQVDALKEQLARWKTDEDFRRSGGTIHYAMDNDVLTLITAPWNTEYQRYLETFIEGDSDAVEATAYLFAEFFLRTGPYLIVPPGQHELEGLWNEVYRKARHEYVGDEGNVRMLLSRANQRSDLSDAELFDLCQKIVAALYGAGGPAAELRRISRLLESGVFHRIESYRDLEGSNPFAFPELSDEKDFDHRKRHLLDILNRLRPARHVRKHVKRVSDNNTVDAAVLAKIQSINERFESEDAKVKLCFITGDTHIERAASQCLTSRCSFAEASIRSPLAFLADPTFFSTVGVDAPRFQVRHPGTTDSVSIGSIGEWIDVLFPDRSEHYPDKRFSRVNMRTRDEEVESGIKQWATFVTSASLSFRVSKSFLIEQTSLLMKEIRHRDVTEIHDRLTNLHEQLVHVGDQALRRFGISSALAGFWSLDPTGRTPERSIPGIKFDSFPAATRVVSKLRQTGSFKDLQKGVNRGWVNELKGEDDSGYTTYVVFSLAFALAGEWKTAYTIAAGAYGIARAKRKYEPKGPSTVKGDEAAYLCAIFSRLCAKRKDDVEESRKWLIDAKRIQTKEDPIRRSLQGTRLVAYVDPRFKAEELAQDLTVTFFNLFREGREGPSDPERREVERLVEASRKLLDVLPDVGTEKEEHVKAYVKEQIIVNFLQLQMLAWERTEGTVILEKECRELIDYLSDKVFGKDRMTPVHLVPASNLVLFILICSSALFFREAVGCPLCQYNVRHLSL